MAVIYDETTLAALERIRDRGDPDAAALLDAHHAEARLAREADEAAREDAANMASLDWHVARIARRYPGAKVEERRGLTVVVIPDFPLPKGWDRPSARVWFPVHATSPTYFPPRCFWLEPDVRTKHGNMPPYGWLDTHAGGLYVKIAWGAWDPRRDDLSKVAHAIRGGLAHILSPHYRHPCDS